MCVSACVCGRELSTLDAGATRLSFTLFCFATELLLTHLFFSACFESFFLSSFYASLSWDLSFGSAAVGQQVSRRISECGWEMGLACWAPGFVFGASHCPAEQPNSPQPQCTCYSCQHPAATAASTLHAPYTHPSRALKDVTPVLGLVFWRKEGRRDEKRTTGRLFFLFH